MKISMDYDGTLDQQEVLDYAKDLIEAGHELYIVTMRHKNRKDGNQDIYDLCEDLGLSHDRVKFTDGHLKEHFFNQSGGFAFHLDDCQWQCDNLKSTLGVYYNSQDDWKELCDLALI